MADDNRTHQMKNNKMIYNGKCLWIEIEKLNNYCTESCEDR